MSIKKQVFTDIGAYLMDKLKDFEVDEDAPELALPDLKWFDKQMGQFNNPEQFYAMPLPCILLEFGQFAWQTAANNQQRGTGILRFYIYFENYADSFTGSVNSELALRYFEFTEKVQQALQGFTLPYMTALERVADSEDTAQDMIITNMIEYSTTITDLATDRARNYVLVDPDVQVERKRETSRPEPDTFTDGFITI